MLKILACVLVACAPTVALAGGDTNQVLPPPDGNTTAETPRPSDANGAGPARGDAKSPDRAEKDGPKWTEVVLCVVGVLTFIGATCAGAFKWAKPAWVAKSKGRSDEREYRQVLRQELGTIRMLGSPDIPNIPVELLDTFVSLDISADVSRAREEDSAPSAVRGELERRLTPESVLKRAFEKYRMLLILGDPGCGKTTLLRYYAMLCVKGERHAELGFEDAPLPIYFPLRDISFQDHEPWLLHECLAQWARRHQRPNLSADVFQEWLQNRDTLVLLDGFDEISDMERRREVCEWIDSVAEGLTRARFAVTSRWTGYRKLDRIQIGFDHLRAEVKEFSPQQQSEFLTKWFREVYTKETPDEGVAAKEWQQRQEQQALDRARAITDFLNKDDNKGIRQLAAVPVLLQIIAVIWKEQGVLPQGRAHLYRIALDYLLDYRDRKRKIYPVLPASPARRVLSPVGLWMQEALHADEVQRTQLHEYVQPIIDTLNVPARAPASEVTAQRFCENLRDRAGLIADCGQDAYMFRHKSFREYLAGLELAKIRPEDQPRLSEVAGYLGHDWWDEPLRFFMGQVDDKLFDQFMDAFFRSEVSRELDQKAYNLLLAMVAEAPQRRIDSLVRCLNDGRLHDNKKRYIVDCLKTIGSEEAYEAIEVFSEEHAETAAGTYALDVVEADLNYGVTEEPELPHDVFARPVKDFFHPLQGYAKYIRIPGGTFAYSVTEERETVPDLYFAQHPVTNRRYRLFIRYLAGKEAELCSMLPPDAFAQELLVLAGEIDGFTDYLGSDPKVWSEKLRSPYDEEKRFKGDDQPVVGVSWFDARAYCFWLSSLEAASQEGRGDRPNRVYRLPSETEWEWAASGGVREYPWPPEKGRPTDKLANYEQNVNETTPVGRYREGATPEGLMDMAGNVFEWMENWRDEDKDVRWLRGGSWIAGDTYLACSRREGSNLFNHLEDFGFRVLCSQS